MQWRVILNLKRASHLNHSYTKKPVFKTGFFVLSISNSIYYSQKLIKNYFFKLDPISLKSENYQKWKKVIIICITAT